MKRRQNPRECGLIPAVTQLRPTAASLPPTLVAAVEMGYGHLRAATALADHLGLEVAAIDRPPFADPGEARRWRRMRQAYELVSRMSQIPIAGVPFRLALDAATEIADGDGHRPVPPGLAARRLAHLVDTGLGRALAERLDGSGETLLSTFYAPAIAADRLARSPVVCVVTDSDLHRIWVPVEPETSRIVYCVPSRRASRRLRSYGVPAQRIHFTGFPLPDELTGGRALGVLKGNLAARLARLDPGRVFFDGRRREVEATLGHPPAAERGRPPLLVFAIGGAGAQAQGAKPLLAALAPELRRGTLRLVLVAGVRSEVAALFSRAIDRLGLGDVPPSALQILHEPDFASYYRAFNALLADADLLVTKPSELVFFAALGLPLLLTRPVGRHESVNRRWVVGRRAGFDLPPTRHLVGWLQHHLADGSLAGSAWAGHCTTPRRGTFRVVAVTAATAAGEAPPPLEPMREGADGA